MENNYSFLCVQDFDGAVDGVHVRRYRAGGTYELPLSFAAERVQNGKLQPVDVQAIGDPDDFPEDYAEFEVLQALELPEDGSGDAPQVLQPGQVIGMSAAEAEAFVEEGILKRLESGGGSPEGEGDSHKEHKEHKEDGEKGGAGAPLNKGGRPGKRKAVDS